jgi:plastocyanin
MSAILLSASASFAVFAGAEPNTHQIIIQGGEYIPAELTIQVGDTVQWINKDFIPHTATAQDEAEQVLWDTGNLNKGDSAEVQFTEVGLSEYICLYHPVMKAQITVEAVL